MLATHLPPLQSPTRAARWGLPFWVAAALSAWAVAGHAQEHTPSQTPEAPAASAAPASAPAEAAEPATSSLRFSGFATAGLVYSNMAAPWGFRRDVLQRGSLGGEGVQAGVDSRLGLQANWQISDQWDAVVQGVLKPIASGAPAAQRVEWAFVSYRPADAWMARVGRVSTDTYLATQYSNVGFVDPWVRPNMEFYGWTSLPSVDGFDVVHNWNQGDTRWRAKVLAGQSTLEVPTLLGQPIQFKGRDMVGASLTREDGAFLAKVSYIQLKYSFNTDGLVAPLMTGLQGIASSPFMPAAIRAEAQTLRTQIPGASSARYFAASFQYRTGPWLAQAELSQNDSPSVDQNSQHYTTSLAYRSGPLTFFGTAGRAKPKYAAAATPQWQGPLTPIVGPVAAANIQALGSAAAATANVARIEQSSVGAGLRWDFYERMAFKVQIDHFKVAASGSALWTGGTPAAQSGNVFSIVIDTVF